MIWHDINNIYADSESSEASTSFSQTLHATNGFGSTRECFQGTNAVAANFEGPSTYNKFCMTFGII